MGNKKGRKGKYYTHVEPKLNLIKNWCKDGDLETDICEKLHVAISTFSNYKREHPELRKALEKGKEEIDYAIENSCIKRALGYKYEETTKERVYNKDTLEWEFIVTKVVTKEMAGDTTAQIFLMKNRMPKKYRDKHDLDIDIKEIPKIILSRGKNG